MSTPRPRPADWIDRAPFLSPPPPCSAGGAPCRPEQLSLRTMNFGQAWRTPRVRDVTYELVVPVAFAAAVLAKGFDELVADARKRPDPSDRFEAALAAAGWPTPERFLEDERLAALVPRFDWHTVLLEWLGDGPPDLDPGYVLNTIDRVVRAGAGFRFEGKARPADPPEGERLAYQDV